MSLVGESRVYLDYTRIAWRLDRVSHARIDLSLNGIGEDINARMAIFPMFKRLGPSSSYPPLH